MAVSIGYWYDNIDKYDKMLVGMEYLWWWWCYAISIGGLLIVINMILICGFIADEIKRESHEMIKGMQWPTALWQEKLIINIFLSISKFRVIMISNLSWGIICWSTFIIGNQFVSILTAVFVEHLYNEIITNDDSVTSIYNPWTLTHQPKIKSPDLYLFLDSKRTLYLFS